MKRAKLLSCGFSDLCRPDVNVHSDCRNDMPNEPSPHLGWKATNFVQGDRPMTANQPTRFGGHWTRQNCQLQFAAARTDACA
eukprot:4906049-Amphidinium_carterae.1